MNSLSHLVSHLGFDKTTFPILIVDDDPDIIHSLTLELRHIAPIESYQSPLRALEALRSLEVAVIISDLKMPEMSGIEFFEKAIAIRPHAQRILLTAFYDLANPENSINRARLHSLVAKPWESPALAETVSQSYRQFLLSKENETLRKIALTDALTGVANHRYFWERLDSEFSRSKRFQRPLSLILADVDNFKHYNDTHGHLEGDRILHQVAQALEHGRRNMDLVARYGGEEFAIILPEISHATALEIGKRHLERVLKATGISLSMGAASYPEDSQSPTELVYDADQALLHAKKTGKARICHVSEVPNENTNRDPNDPQ